MSFQESSIEVILKFCFTVILVTYTATSESTESITSLLVSPVTETNIELSMIVASPNIKEDVAVEGTLMRKGILDDI